jgi:hypothetical protein
METIELHKTGTFSELVQNWDSDESKSVPLLRKF